MSHKLLIAPLLIAVASWVGRRWGPAVGGWFIALPLTSGPVLLILALERGASFARGACVGAMLAVVSLSAFAIAYAWSARSSGWKRSSIMACVAYLGCTWMLQFVPVPPVGWTFTMTCTLLVAAISIMPIEASRHRFEARSVPPPLWDVLVRMALATVLVWTLARMANTVGPRLSGLLTPFPVAATILAAFTHRSDGSAAAAQFLRSVLIGLFSFAAFLLVLELSLTRWTVSAAFATATLSTLTFHAGAWRWIRYPAPLPSQLRLSHE